MTSLSQAAQDAIMVYRIAIKGMPCPICAETICGHGFGEMLAAEIAPHPQTSSPRNDMAGLQRLAENVRRGGPTQIGVTPVQLRLLNGIKAFREEMGFSPSYEEMMTMADVKSKASINRIISGLRDRGHIEFRPGKSRSVVIVGELA